ncbi:MAG: DUF5687 family protein [Bacteroidota bacterium]
MILELFSLSRKESFRSRLRNKNIFINLLLGFFVLYFAAVFASLGFLLPRILEEDIGISGDPLVIVNSFLLTYFGMDLFVRFMMQSLPVISIKPFLHLPIEKSTIVNYLLIKSKFSAFNYIPLLFIIPFSFNLPHYGYSTPQILTWILAVTMFLMSNNYLNFILKRSFNDNVKFLLPALIIFVILYALDYFNIFSAKHYFGILLNNIVREPILLFIPFASILLFYYINYNYLVSRINLDDTVKSKSEVASLNSMEWANSFGEIAPYIKLDLKMIWRNKRPKTLVYMSFALLFYGLIFYPNPVYQDKPTFMVFVAVFITGVFAINFGQYIPAWDSAHYSMLMTQRTNLLTYVKSKFAIMSIAVVLFFVLSIPYVYFGWEILLLHFAAAIYNIGVNILLLLMMSSFNNKAIDLSRSAVMNYQGTGAKQWLMVIPILALPVLIYWIGDMIYGFAGSISLIVILGLLGIVFHQKLIYIVATQLAERKYKIIEAFSEK